MSEKRYNVVHDLISNCSSFPPFVVECIARFESWGPVLKPLLGIEKETLRVYDYVDVQHENGLYERCMITAKTGNDWTVVRLESGVSEEINCNATAMVLQGSLSLRPITRESMKDIAIEDLVMFCNDGAWEKALVRDIKGGQICVQFPHYMNLQPTEGDVIQQVWIHADEKTRVKRWMHQAKKAVNKAGELVGSAVGATENAWKSMDEKFQLEEKIESIAGKTEKALSWAEKHFHTVWNKIPKKQQRKMAGALEFVGPAIDLANQGVQAGRAYQALNASIAEKGVEAAMAEITGAATTGAMYIGGAVLVAGTAYGSYKLAEKHYPEQTHRAKMRAKDEVDYTMWGGIDLGKVFMKGIGKRWKESKQERLAKEVNRSHLKLDLLGDAQLLRVVEDFETRCNPPESVPAGTILTVLQYDSEESMMLVDCERFAMAQWLGPKEIRLCEMVDPDQVGSQINLLKLAGEIEDTQSGDTGELISNENRLP